MPGSSETDFFTLVSLYGCPKLGLFRKVLLTQSYRQTLLALGICIQTGKAKPETTTPECCPPHSNPSSLPEP